jgi:hypothetical protein
MGMDELERLGFKSVRPQQKCESSPEATRSDGQPWEFVGGIQFDRLATIYAPDGVAVLHIRLPRPESVANHPEEAYRTLVKRWPDGSIKYFLIDFKRLVEE